MKKQQAKTAKLLAKLMKQVKADKKAKKAANKKKTKKDLKKARKSQLDAEAAAARARAELARVKREAADRLKAERRKCAGKCDREFPILVGPKNIKNTETRSVVVIGDRTHNKKRWSQVKTPARLFWHPKGLKKTSKHIKRAGRTIGAVHKKVKRISEAPLVEKPLF